MELREAKITDITAIQTLRNAVKENTLSDPNLVTDADCADHLTRKGKGWVYEKDGEIVGFSIVNLIENNIWALFVHPDAEKNGIGRALHGVMLDWYFTQTSSKVWLSTSPKTRAEGFYRQAGWTEAGLYGKGEIKFEMTQADWKNQRTKLG